MDHPVLLTGGAGFIGTNVAHRLLAGGQPVILLDDLSRKGVEANAERLCARYGSSCELLRGDVRDERLVRAAVRRSGAVVHLAAQVAVTKSLDDPTTDFEVNAFGTLNVLEALRATPRPLLYTSTNKVYGPLDDVALVGGSRRYEPADASLRAHGLDERRPLDFHSPYGCSKGAADQYVLDYARIYGLPAVVFRMSCIYGPHQCGSEDQGWVAHFARSFLHERPLTIFGDGLQVRDALFADDLVEAMRRAFARMPDVQGRAFNIGGGVSQTVTLLELIDLLTELHGHAPPVEHRRARPADQKYYVSDVRRFQAATGWQPRVSVRDGVALLYRHLARGDEGADTSTRGVRQGGGGADVAALEP
ncbi:MAG TPA: NAD-dependent epimerase/dehydratase family protein [Polyangia bacterium]|nr:NAD-dependent epimerase/dehydratase family protein [Polyangia bacterium]